MLDMLSPILVTGGSGFIGHRIVERLSGKAELHTTYRNHPIELKGVTAHQLELTNFSHIHNLVRQIRPRVIIHSAALVDTGLCEKEPGQAMNINVEATRATLEACNPHETYFIFLSTDMVFDGKRGGYLEKDPISPINRYGWTKAQAETIVKESPVPSLICRVGLVYGPPNPVGSWGFLKWCLGGLRKGEKIRGFVDEYRTPIYMEDLVLVIRESIEMRLEGILHLAGPETISRYDFAVRLARIFGYDTELVEKASIHDYTGGGERPADCSLNTSRLQRLYAHHPLEVTEGLLKLKAFLESN